MLFFIYKKVFTSPVYIRLYLVCVLKSQVVETEQCGTVGSKMAAWDKQCHSTLGNKNY